MKNPKTISNEFSDFVPSPDCCGAPTVDDRSKLNFVLPLERVISQYLKKSGTPQYPFVEFKVDGDKTLLIDTTDNSFSLLSKNEIVSKGRNAIDCLIRIFNLTLESAIEWLKTIFSEDDIALITKDYAR